MIQVQPQPHYTFVIRTLMRLFEQGLLTNVEEIDVEPAYGFDAQLRYNNKHVRYIHGASLDINGNGASHIATLKERAKRFMTNFGYNTPQGKAFVSPRYLNEIQNYLNRYGLEEHNTFAEVPTYIETVIGLPCFIKPNDGYRGTDVYRCTTMEEVQSVLEVMQKRCYELIIVEAAANFPEYRLVIYDYAFFACYSKSPLAIRGDGHSTIESLVYAAKHSLESTGRTLDVEALKPHIDIRMKQAGLTLQSVIPEGQSVQLLDMANLSVGGTTDDYSDVIHPHWQQLCTELSRDMNLRLVGIDFMCSDITAPEGEYTIIEINAAPSLQAYAAIGKGQAQKVDSLYLSVFNSPPHI